MIVSDDLVLTCEPIEGMTWHNTKNRKVYRFTNGEWIDKDVWYDILIKKQKEEVKMETVVQEVDFKGVEEKTVMPNDGAESQSVEIFHFGDFTVARVKKDFSGKKWQGIGISRQSKDDQRNEKLGDSIAIGRATKSIKMKINGETVRHQYMA